MEQGQERPYFGENFLPYEQWEVHPRMECLNLQEFNEQFEDDVRNGTCSLFHLAWYWCNLHHQVFRTIEELDRIESEIVNHMNRWLGMVNFAGSKAYVAVRIPNRNDKSYCFVFKPVKEFLVMMERFKIMTYNKNDYKDCKYFVPNIAVTIYPLADSQLMTSRNANFEAYIPQRWNATFNTNVRVVKDPYSDTLVPKFRIRLQEVTLGELWLKHPNAACYNQIVFNPRPFTLEGCASPYDLNIWGTFP